MDIYQTNSSDITSANSVSEMIVEGLFPAGFTLEGFSTDQAVTQDDVTVTETRMGVDGRMAAGFIPSAKNVTIMLEANSPSVEYLNQLLDAMTTQKKIFRVHLQSVVPSRGTVYKWGNGVLQTATAMPGQKKMLEPTTWVFQFETFERSAA